MNIGKPAARIVVSGVGVVSPIGIGNPAFWQNLIEGRSGAGRLCAFSSENLPTHFTCEVRDFDPQKHLPKKKFLKVMSRDIQLGVGAAMLAMRDAGLRKGSVDPDRLGVVFGAGRISTTPQELARSVRRFARKQKPFDAALWTEDDMQEIAPLWLLRQLPNMPACHVSIAFDARGPNNTITNRDTSALMSLMEAVNVIERGGADCMIVGACGSNIQPVDIAKFCLYEELTKRDDNPKTACRPFDLDRDGTIAGEGAAAFVIESLSHAERRGAKIYAEILGLGGGCDGRPQKRAMGSPGLVHAIRAAMTSAGITPGELGHINAQGIASLKEDAIEAASYREALGESAKKIPVTALKSYFGHSDAGSGAMELAGSLFALKNGLIPQTLNYETPDPACDLNVVRNGPIEFTQPTALCVNRTRLGQSAAVVLRRLYDPTIKLLHSRPTEQL